MLAPVSTAGKTHIVGASAATKNKQKLNPIATAPALAPLLRTAGLIYAAKPRAEAGRRVHRVRSASRSLQVRFLGKGSKDYIYVYIHEIGLLLESGV